jgi:hypothetical protein
LSLCAHCPTVRTLVDGRVIASCASASEAPQRAHAYFKPQCKTPKTSHCAHLGGWPRDRPQCVSRRADHHILVGEALILLHGAEVQLIAPGALVVVNVVQDLNPSEPALDRCTEAGLQTGIAASAAGARNRPSAGEVHCTRWALDWTATRSLCMYKLRRIHEGCCSLLSSASTAAVVSKIC